MTARTTTKDRLLEAAIAVIDRRGEAGLKVDEIADMAQITKPSLYHFFGDREGLVVAAQAERFRRSLRHGLEAGLQLVRACASRDEYETIVRTALTQFGDPAAVERRRVRLDVLGSATARPALMVQINEIMVEAAEDLAEIAEIGRRRGWIAATFSSQSIAVWWYGMLLGRYLAENNPHFDVAEWDAIATSALVHLMFG